MQTTLNQYGAFYVKNETGNVDQKKRLFLPLNNLWYHLFISGQKTWEMRGVSSAFNLDNIEIGKNVEIRRGYQYDPVWGKIENLIVVNSLKDIPKPIYDETIPPSVRDNPKVVEFLDNYLSKYHRFILEPISKL
ncbi:MAG: hypothetical protein WBL02_10145 [Methanomethylovorans sp.]|uniref:hypothetical protein n=1 Tax=Methanomethylovorans sp. TaxID=2758717 RepID=UPI003C741A4B